MFEDFWFEKRVIDVVDFLSDVPIIGRMGNPYEMRWQEYLAVQGISYFFLYKGIRLLIKRI